METLNTAFFFVIEKIIGLQSFFLREAWTIGRGVLFISFALAAVNYAISGQGLKESLVKIGKALFFFVLVMVMYPRIISSITEWTFEKAHASAYLSVESYISGARTAAAAATEREEGSTVKGTYGSRVMTSEKVSEDRDPAAFFSNILATLDYGGFKYTCVAPAGALEAVLLIAGECIRYSEEAPKGPFGIPSDIGRLVIGLICGFFVIFTGILSVLEYLMAYMEFMLVTSVGVILFPLSLWEGSRFMAEKLIGAITGFFVKLLFCNICIFLMLYGFLSLARGYTETPFTGRPDEIVVVLFVSLLFFYLCKSAPALAQSLLSGTPSLSAAGAMSAMGGAIAGAGAALGVAKAAGGMMAGGAAKTAFAGAGAIAQAGAAAKAAGDLGGGFGQKAGAFMSSMGGSAKEGFRSSAGDLARSLIGGKGRGGGSGGGAGAGVNRHSQSQKFLNEKNADGTKKTFSEQLAGRREAGTNAGLDYMARQEARRNKNTEKADHS